MHKFFLLALCLLSHHQGWTSPKSKAVVDADAFDAHVSTFYGRSSEMLTEELLFISQYDCIFIPDGVFGDYIDLLCSLPPRSKHLPFIIKMIQKTDPLLQEAGINLALASVEALHDYSGLEDPICDLLKKPDLDPWVLYAIVSFAEQANSSTRTPDLLNLHTSLAEVIYKPPNAKLASSAGKQERIMRARPIYPVEMAKAVFARTMTAFSQPTPRSMAILPYLEKEYGTNGWEETYRAVSRKLQGTTNKK